VAQKKHPEHSHGITQQSNLNESAEKHVCNEQTSSNMPSKSRIKHFRISRDTNEIVLHLIKQCLQAVHHYVVARTQATPERYSNHQSTDQQKMC